MCCDILRLYVSQFFCYVLLKFYPLTANVMCRAMMDAVLPLSHPIHGVDGASMNEVVIPRGMNIVVVIMACNRNKDL